MNQPQTKLRKAAILISSLDTAAADRLLDQMGPQQAAKVRHAIMDLDEIRPAEQSAVIAEFMRQSPAPTMKLDSGIELDGSLAKKLATSATYRPGHGDAPFVDPAFTADQPASDETMHKPFRIFAEAPADKLARHLQREHPQIIALVLTNLPPARSAEILSHFPAAVQTEIMQRVAQSDESDPEVLRDIERELAASLTAETANSGQKSAGSAGIAVAQAILAATKTSQRQELLEHLKQKDGPLTTRLDPASTLRTDAATSDIAPRRVAPKSQLAEAADRVTDDHEPESPIEFKDMIHFDNRSLATVLRHVNPQLALLALTGADTQLVDRIMQQLPAPEAKALRGRMTKIGPLRLSDVLTAQQEFARIAGRLIAKGMIAELSAVSSQRSARSLALADR